MQQYAKYAVVAYETDMPSLCFTLCGVQTAWQFTANY